MKLKPTKIVTFLLLTAFLVTSLGSVFGCISCDRGCLSDIHLNNHIDDHSDNHIDDYTDGHVDVHVYVHVGSQTVSLDQHINNKDDSCLDSPIQLGQGVVDKIEIIKWHSNLATISTNERLTTLKNIRFVASNLPQKFPPIISQTILTHRTIVILT